MSGLFISFEGIDGAGKSTHFERLAASLRAQGRVVTSTREPGGTPLAEQLRSLVLHTPMDAMTEALLVFAARRDHVQQVIAPALARGEVVLCDRFTDSSFAYQGGGRAFSWQMLEALESWVQGTGQDVQRLEPALTLWFDLPPEVAAQRLAGARVPDKFEAQPAAFFERVRQGYCQRMAQAPERFVAIDAHGTPEQVWAQVQAAMRTRGYDV